MVAAGAEPTNRSHRVSAQAISHHPFPRRRCIQVAADLAAELNHLLGAEAATSRAAFVCDQVGDQPRPASLVRGAEPSSGVAVKVLMEEQVVMPGRITLE